MKDVKPRGAPASGRSKTAKSRVAPRFGEDDAAAGRSQQSSDPFAGAPRRASASDPERSAGSAKRAASGTERAAESRRAAASRSTPIDVEWEEDVYETASPAASRGKSASAKAKASGTASAAGKTTAGKTAATKAATAKTASGKRPAGDKPASSRPAEAPPASAKTKSSGTKSVRAKAMPARGRAEADEADAPKKAAARRRSEPKRRTRGDRPRRRRFSLLRFAFRMTFTLAILGVIGVGAIVAYYAATLPPVAEWSVPDRPPNVAILAEDGQLIANRGDTGGRAVKLEDLPKYVPQAVVAIEDRRYYSHPGIDPIGLTRAMATNLTSGRLEQGGSTLTQQLAKNMFLTPSRTIERKIQEMLFAVWLEMKYSKDEILGMYLNRVYLGAGATGIDGAAHRYFDKPAEELTLSEAAMIAGLLKAPTYYAPTNDLERSRTRAGLVLDAMHDVGFINDTDYEYAKAHPASVAKPKVATSGGYVADWVAEVLPDFAGSVSQDIVVETTVNLELQELAQSALQGILDKDGAAKGVSQGAVVMLDGSGAVKALVGGRKYGDSQYNRAVSAKRQPGSSFKPFVYLAALEHGLTPNSMRIDQPTRIGNWEPQNYSRKYRGPVSLQTALAHSINTVAAQLAAEVGPKTVVSVAHRMGIESPLEPNASIALGTSEVTLLELTTAFVPFSNGGIGVIPHVVRRIRTADGQLLYERRGGGPGQVVDLRNVGMMNQMLHAVVANGTGHNSQIDGWQTAGKTGTSQDWRDAWFVGYSAFFTAGVWFGNDDNSPTKRATGGSLPAELWKTLMNKVQEGMVPADLPGMDQVPQVVETAPENYEVQYGQPVANAPQQFEPNSAARGGPSDWIPPDQGRQNRGGGFLSRLFGG
ncbi:transglycosylase domain-containing protein [Acuticoccus sediminis]|nr:transglycosylase domain-containing protein [Acuticoccus sediminis]